MTDATFDPNDGTIARLANSAVLKTTLEPDLDATFPRAPRHYGQGISSGRVSTAALVEVLAAARMR